MTESLADSLGHYIQRAHYSAGQIAALSGVPKRTVVNWMNGRVLKPHKWEGLVKIAAALHLNETEATALLQAAAHPTLAELRRQHPDNDLFSSWLAEKTAVSPFQTIADLPYFVGREQEMADLQTRLRDGATVTICNLQGMGGVGKTTLAAHLAYALRPFFPDGVLWARLDTTDTMTILADFAAAYGEDVSGRRTIESRATAVRGILADKRTLIVLDNAETSGQIRPLLPPTMGKTAVIITTRHDLAVTDGLHRAPITPFDPARQEAFALFSKILGEQRARQEQTELCVIADLLGQLPLALAIAAGRLGGMETAVYLSQLQQENARLDALVREDRSVRLTFDISYNALSSELQLFFAVLGTFGGDDFGGTAVARITETSQAIAKAHLDELAGLSLVQVGRNGRYQLHPLVRAYAQEKIKDDSVWLNMTRHFITYARQRRFDYKQIAYELGNIVTALQTAHQQYPTLYPDSAADMTKYFEITGDYDTADLHLQQAYTIAQRHNNQAQSARILAYQGHMANKRGDYALSDDLLHKGLSFAKTAQQPNSIIFIYTILGGNAYAQGNIAQCESYLEAGLELARQENNTPRQMAALLTNLAGLITKNRDVNLARAQYEEALHILPDTIEHQQARMILLFNLGNLDIQLGDYEQAEKQINQSLLLAHSMRFRERISYYLVERGYLAMHRGQFAASKIDYEKALIIAREIDNGRVLVHALAYMGLLACETNDLKQAKIRLDESFDLAEHLGFQEYAALSLKGMGDCALRQKNAEQAALSYQKALDLFRELNLADFICDTLIGLGDNCLASHHWQMAHTHFTEVYETAKRFRYQLGMALALFGLARTTAVSNPTQSRQQAEESYALLQKMGHWKTAVVEKWLNKYKPSLQT